MLALSACAAGGGQRPTLKAPDISRMDVGRAISGAAEPAGMRSTPWWNAYRDPQLDRLLATARQEAPSIAVAAARIAHAEAGLNGAQADDQLQIAGTGQIVGEYFPDHYIYPAPYAGRAGSEGELAATARIHLDFWGKRREAIKAAEARVDVAKAEADDAILLLQTAVAEAYVRLDAAYRVRDVARAGLVQRQGVIDLISYREKAGLATDLDAVQAREAITGTRSEIARLGGEIARRRDEIAALLGRGPGFGDTIARPALSGIADPAPLSALPAELLGYRPDVAAARDAAWAAAHEIGVARAAFYPDVDLAGFAGLSALSLDHLLRPGSVAAGIGPAITLPIFDAGRLRSNLKARDAEYDEAVGAYDSTIATALQQVADGIATLKAERTRKVEADQAEAHWAHIVELQKIRERQGLSSAQDRLSTETALLLSQAAAADANARVAVAQIDLIRALGGAWAPSNSSHERQTSK